MRPKAQEPRKVGPADICRKVAERDPGPRRVMCQTGVNAESSGDQRAVELSRRETILTSVVPRSEAGISATRSTSSTSSARSS